MNKSERIKKLEKRNERQYKKIEELEAQLKDAEIKQDPYWQDLAEHRGDEISKLRGQIDDQNKKLNIIIKKILSKAEAELIKKLIIFARDNVGNPEFRYKQKEYEELLKKVET